MSAIIIIGKLNDWKRKKKELFTILNIIYSSSSCLLMKYSLTILFVLNFDASVGFHFFFFLTTGHTIGRRHYIFFSVGENANRYSCDRSALNRYIRNKYIILYQTNVTQLLYYYYSWVTLWDYTTVRFFFFHYYFSLKKLALFDCA